MQDELYIDIVTKTIISKLSEEIVATIGEPISELIRGLLLNELSKLISEKFKKETDFLSKTISETEDASKLFINNAAGAIKKHIDEGLERHGGTEDELKAFIQSEINSLRQAFQAEDKYTSLKGLIESQLTGFIGKTKTMVESLREASLSNIETSGNETRELLSAKIKLEAEMLTKAIAETKDSSRLLISSSGNEIKKHIDEKLERNIRTESELKAFIKDEINSLRHTLQTGEAPGPQGITESQLTMFSTKTKALLDKALLQIESSGSELKRFLEDSFEKQKRTVFEQNEQIKDELSAIKQFAMDVLYSQIRQLESEAGMQLGRKTELERKIKDLRELMERAAGSGGKETN